VTISRDLGALVLASALGMAVGCGSDGDGDSDTCRAGEGRSCHCSTGAEGTQTCLADGSWSECDCSEDGTGGSSGDPPVGTGGTDLGSGGSGDPPNNDPVANLEACIDTLPDWVQQNLIDAGTEPAIIDAIIDACTEFAPSGDERGLHGAAQPRREPADSGVLEAS